ncbi:MAG: 2-C-methyl-D-erythritol 2,4-cyclodiphosphate synthase [bacterium ADurb.Bin429]|nr:MAG: 2-C-methyl-D-erythritol 2,4-cyclodiphosphate synthase [bacterium ADurb.Bin429]
MPHALGLLGHSDADVLTHAIMDALLGAAALGDIGMHFPDTDPQYRGVSSLNLLRQVGAFLRQQGYTVSNIDATVVAQAPKLAPHIPAMRARLAEALEVTVARVSVKATTTEGLGFAGEGAGMAAYATACLRRAEPLSELA